MYKMIWRVRRSINFQLMSSFFSINLDLYRMQNDPNREQEGLTMHTNFSQTLLQDHFRASQLQEHNLIEWTDGPFPALPPTTTSTRSATSS